MRAKERSKLYYDRRINPKIFMPSDKIFLRKGLKLGKLGNRTDGPFTVIEVLDNNRVKLHI